MTRANPKVDVRHIAEPLQSLVVAMDRIKTDPTNARRPPQKNVAAVVTSLQRYGQRKPIVVNRKTGTIEAGNATYDAARVLGWTQIAAVFVDDDAKTATGYAIADNRTSELAEWDDATLAQLLQDLSLTGGPLVGFDDADIVRLLRSVQSTPEDGFDITQAIRSPTVATRVVRGQIWACGRHRLMCGDAANAEDVAMLMDGQSAQVCFTDPPWNVGIGLDSNPLHRQRTGLQNDSVSPTEYDALLRGFARNLHDRLVGDLYCVLGTEQWPRLDAVLRDAGFHWSATIIWVKDIFVLGRSKYHRRYEPIWYGWRGNGKSSFVGVRDEDDVWEYPRPRVSEEHPTMKPVALVKRAIMNSSKRDGNVVDLFLGSGTTMIATEQLNRVCYGMEIDPVYCGVAIARWEAFSGQKAKLVRDA